MARNAVIPEQKRMCLGGAVKRIRRATNKTQDALAQKAGVNPGYMSRIENGERQPSAEVLLKIAEFLEVDLDDISYLANVYVLTEAAA